MERAIVPYIPPAVHPSVVNLDPIHLGIVRVVFGPVLPPAMVWERSFRNLLPDFESQSIHRPICLSVLPPAVLPMRFWSQELEYSLLSLIGMAAPPELPQVSSAELVDLDDIEGSATLMDIFEVFSAVPV